MVVVYCVVCQFFRSNCRRKGKSTGRKSEKKQDKDQSCPLIQEKKRKSGRQILKKATLLYVQPGHIIPSDGEVIEGIASVDESAITGESAPVIRESGGDRSAVTGGTKVISDRIVIRITAEQGNTFLDHMISLVEGAKRQKTPNEIALTILLSGLINHFSFGSRYTSCIFFIQSEMLQVYRKI